MGSLELSGLRKELQRPAAQLLALARRAGVRVQVNSVKRSAAQQAKLYAKYLRGENPYPVAPPGSSKHELGLAFDISTFPDVNEQLGAVWESWGGTWGGKFRDPVHYEL